MALLDVELRNGSVALASSLELVVALDLILTWVCITSVSHLSFRKRSYSAVGINAASDF